MVIEGVTPTLLFALFTLMAPLVPVIVVATESVAVRVWLPPLSRVALKLPVPEASVEFAGNCAMLSVLENCTVPAYAGVVLPKLSCAVTVKLNDAPTVALAGAETLNFEVEAGVTLTVMVPLTEPLLLSVLVIV